MRTNPVTQELLTTSAYKAIRDKAKPGDHLIHGNGFIAALSPELYERIHELTFEDIKSKATAFAIL